MNILIVDDSKSLQLLLKRLFQNEGYDNLLLAESAQEAFEILGVDGHPNQTAPAIDIILLDIMMPEINGIEACRRIKAVKALSDIPIIMVTAMTQNKDLELAFEAGAMDYITKPVNRVELLARVRSALNLKQEMDNRMRVTRELENANAKLQLLASLDGLTGIANRRHFEHTFDKEWKRALREQNTLSLALLDIDFFKPYNDCYGHQAGDDCLKEVAKVITGLLKRPGDLLARYGGEEFVIILPDTRAENAVSLAEDIRAGIEGKGIPHKKSKASKFVTASIGVAAATPTKDNSPEGLIEAADVALYQAKKKGRNRVVRDLQYRMSNINCRT